MKINPSIFREYDIRGIAGKDLSPEFAYHLGRAYGTYLRENLPGKSLPRVSIGKDCRLTGEEYAKSLCQGIIESGINVVLLGTCPTPATYFSLFHLGLDGGIMVTGSHNPADFNGFKICFGKTTLFGEAIQKLRSIMESQKYYSNGGPGKIEEVDILTPYAETICEQMSPGPHRKKVVIDAGNGTASNVAPKVFEALGAEVIPLYCELDGRFPNHHPDPTEAKNLKALIETVRQEKADFGIAFDGDSDRVGIVDENGKVIYGDEILVILSRELLKQNPGAWIISEVKSSYRLYQDIAKHGGKALMWKTGHSLIKSKMKEIQALLAGEMSGHIFFADRYYGYDDAIYAAARIYEIATKNTEPFSHLIADLPKTVVTPEIRLDCEESKKFEIIEKTKALLSSKYSINDIDGVRVEFTDGWGLVRASNTQAILVLRFEAISKNRLIEIKDIVESAVGSAYQQLGLSPLSLPDLNL